MRIIKAIMIADSELKQRIDHSLDTFFTSSVSMAKKVSPSYVQLWETVQGLSQSGGKRLRPLMTFLAYRAFGGKDEESVLPVATAQELLHLCLLIHDDVIDRDTIRYGRPNITGTYQQNYTHYVQDNETALHYANSVALLTGDLLLSASHELISSSTIDCDQKTKIHELFSQAIFEVAAGELLDMEAAFIPEKHGYSLLIAHYKTASYSFINPLLTGAILAGSSDKQLESLMTYAKNLGIAYQLVDDLLGVFGDTLKTGKSILGDIREGKHTLLVEETLSRLSEEEKVVFSLGFGKVNASVVDVENVKHLMEKSGGRMAVEERIKEYVREANNGLNQLNLSAEHQAEFEDLTRVVTERSF